MKIPANLPKFLQGVKRSELPTRKCVVCAEKFVVTRHDKTVCSHLCSVKKWQAEHIEEHAKQKRRYKLSRLGTTPEEFDRLYELQGRTCALCDKPEETDKRRLAVDHDHKTGKVRGLLCFAHNTMIGKAGDDPTLLRLAAKYVERGGI